MISSIGSGGGVITTSYGELEIIYENEQGRQWGIGVQLPWSKSNKKQYFKIS
jgi:hypothetical protein